jgi:site-specific recombinase XerD
MNNISISIFLDGRRKKANGYLPVKLRVYDSKIKKTRLYPFSKIKTDSIDKSIILETVNTGFKSQKALDDVVYADRPKKDKKILKTFFTETEIKASRIAEKLIPFTFDEFEKKMFDNRIKTDGLSQCYKDTIDGFERKKSYSTASNYRLSRNSLLRYATELKKPLCFEIITVQFLDGYESFMLEDLERSETTVSMYLRALRAIFNKAIRDRLILPEQYPFGKGKYTIPTGDKVIKALTKKQLSLLLNGIPQTTEQQKAKDFWFFSFYAQGMNIKDMALLQFQHIKEDSIQYYRAKTKTTGKRKPRLIYITINNYIADFIKEYQSINGSSTDLVFPIISKSSDAKLQHNRIKNFTKFINQNFLKYAKAVGVNEKVSTYWARHSFTNTLANNGASIEFMSEALNHSDIKTTQNYIAGFEESRKKEMMQELMKF